MFDLGKITNKNNKKHIEKRPYVPDHLDRVLIIGGFGSRETNALLNLIGHRDDIDKVYLYANDLSEPKY